jgi:3-phenylpropionate/trans-cinnamate dioxygenase ferredoxin subunit
MTGPAKTDDGAGSPKPADRFIDVLAVDELPPSSQKSVAYGFQRVLLCHTPRGIHAVADLCPHALQPLAGSDITDGIIRCARHGASFDLATGQPVNGVTNKSLRVYAVTIRDGRIGIAVAGPPERR